MQQDTHSDPNRSKIESESQPEWTIEDAKILTGGNFIKLLRNLPQVPKLLKGDNTPLLNFLDYMNRQNPDADFIRVNLLGLDKLSVVIGNSPRAINQIYFTPESAIKDFGIAGGIMSGNIRLWKDIENFITIQDSTKWRELRKENTEHLYARGAKLYGDLLSDKINTLWQSGEFPEIITDHFIDNLTFEIALKAIMPNFEISEDDHEQFSWSTNVISNFLFSRLTKSKDAQYQDARESDNVFRASQIFGALNKRLKQQMVADGESHTSFYRSTYDHYMKSFAGKGLGLDSGADDEEYVDALMSSWVASMLEASGGTSGSFLSNSILMLAQKPNVFIELQNQLDEGNIGEAHRLLYEQTIIPAAQRGPSVPFTPRRQVADIKDVDGNVIVPHTSETQMILANIYSAANMDGADSELAWIHTDQGRNPLRHCPGKEPVQAMSIVFQQFLASHCSDLTILDEGEWQAGSALRRIGLKIQIGG